MDSLHHVTSEIPVKGSRDKGVSRARAVDDGHLNHGERAVAALGVREVHTIDLIGRHDRRDPKQFTQFAACLLPIRFDAEDGLAITHRAEDNIRHPCNWFQHLTSVLRTPQQGPVVDVEGDGNATAVSLVNEVTHHSRSILG